MLSTSAALGASASITADVDGIATYAPELGELSHLVVDDSHLRFTYIAAWLTCTATIDFDLAREP